MTISYNPFDPAQVDDDEEVLTQLRRDDRVAAVLPGVYYVTRYDDVAEISRDAKRFPQAPFRPLEEDTRSADELQLGESNPPGHTKVRKILASVLSPPRIRALEPLVDRVCADLVDAFKTKGSADLVGELGRPLPAQVIGELTGVPPKTGTSCTSTPTSSSTPCRSRIASCNRRRSTASASSTCTSSR